MMFVFRLVVALGLAAAPLLLSPAMAFETANPHAACNSPSVLFLLKEKIDYRFRMKNGRKLYTKSITDVAQTYSRQADEQHLTGRQFCHAILRLSDNRSRDMWYLLETGFAFAGIPKMKGIDFCVAGLDPDHIYGKKCSTVRNSIGW